MKKLSIALVFVFLGLTTYGSVATYGAIQLSQIVQNDYVEVSVESLPKAVTTALRTAYPQANIVKASVNEKKQYKLDIAVDDQKATVYTDVDGNWLKI